MRAIIIIVAIIVALLWTACGDDNRPPSRQPPPLAHPALFRASTYQEAEQHDGFCRASGYATNLHTAPCFFTLYSRWARGYGYSFIGPVAPGETGWAYGDIGDESSGVRYYVHDCAGVYLEPTYLEQSCDDGYREESGDRAAHDATARMTTEHEYDDHDDEQHTEPDHAY